MPSSGHVTSIRAVPAAQCQARTWVLASVTALALRYACGDVLDHPFLISDHTICCRRWTSRVAAKANQIQQTCLNLYVILVAFLLLDADCTTCHCLPQMQTLLQQMQDRFETMSISIISRVDEMGSKLDDLEKQIGDLIEQSSSAAEQQPTLSKK